MSTTSTATTAASAASIAAAAASAGTGTITQPMLAVTRERYGAPETLRLTTVDRPTPGDHQVLVEVAAAGVDRGVWHLVTGLPYIVRLAGFGLTRPKQPIIGMDLAGRVVEVGAGVTRFEVGDEVFGIGVGAYAEFALADEAKLAHRPDGIDADAAAAIAISGVTALQALREGGVESGRRVLVLGASGGVGSFAVQLAKRAGAHVTGVASTAKLDLVRSLGADAVVDYTTDDALAGRYDLIIDTGGRNPVRRLRRALTQHGTAVIVGGEGGSRLTGGFERQLRAIALSPFVSQRLFPLMPKEGGDDIAELARLLAAGELRSHVDRTYPFAGAPTAIADLAAGRIAGKAVVRVADPS